MNSLKPTNQKSVVKQNNDTFGMYINGDAIRNLINQTVGGKGGQRFITAITSAVSTNPILQTCTHKSIINAALLGESLGLSPSPQLGQYYLVPYNNTKQSCTDAQFQLGYKGYIQLAIRSGYYKTINVISIKEGELKKYNPLTEELEVNLIEDDELRENANTIGYYAMFEYLNGFRKAIFWSIKKMKSHALKYSQAYKRDLAKNTNYSFWTSNFDDMAHKTMLRQLISKWGIMSIELQKALEADSAVIDENLNPNFVDQPDAFDQPEITNTAEEAEIKVIEEGYKDPFNN